MTNSPAGVRRGRPKRSATPKSRSATASKAVATENFRWRNQVLDRDEQHKLRRDILLRTAAQAFNETSFHTTTLDDLAQRLNVTKPALYYYIKDKDDILFECQRMALELIKDVLIEHEMTVATGVERLRQFLSRYTDLMMDDFGVCLVRTGLRPLKAESRAKLVMFARQIDQRLQAIIKQGIEDGSIIDIDPRLAANAIFGAFNGIAQWYKPNRALSKDVIAKTYIDLFIRSIGRTSPAAK